MNISRRTGARVAIGACGPVALTALSGVFTPADATAIGCGPRATEIGVVEALRPQRVGNQVHGNGYIDCTGAGGINTQVLVVLQKNITGSWENVAQAGGTTNATAIINCAASGGTPYRWRTSIIGEVRVQASGVLYDTQGASSPEAPRIVC